MAGDPSSRDARSMTRIRHVGVWLVVSLLIVTLIVTLVGEVLG
jgi:hypothetical protein